MMATRGRGGGADYDHLIKLLLIGDSGERYRLRPPGLLCDSRYRREALSDAYGQRPCRP